MFYGQLCVQLWPFPALGKEEIWQENIQRTTEIIKTLLSMEIII